ncbi:MAG: aminotransferase class III-fold pyridoxal phosphate-dependent enzyme, partial [Ginsengibacter sp.]
TKAVVDQHKNEIACLIYEPLLQGAGGMKMFAPGPLNTLLSLLKKEEIICIADEVLTGFYRTGKFFAGDYLLEKADIICLSKALTGGTMALGVTACTQKIYDAFVSDDKTKTLFHGHSFTANPLACTASLASLTLLQKKNYKNKIDRIVNMQTQFSERLEKYKEKKIIRNVRHLGTIIAFEVNTKENDGYLNNITNDFTKFCLEKGVYLRPMGNTIYLMPPYCIKKKELEKLYGVTLEFLDKNYSNEG